MKKKVEVKSIDELEFAPVIRGNPNPDFVESLLKVSKMLQELREAGFTLEDNEEPRDDIDKKEKEK